MKGKIRSDHHREMLRRSALGNKRALGYKQTPETVANMREAARIRLEKHGVPVCGKHRGTRLEQKLITLLESAGFAVEPQKRFARFSVDAYVDELKVGFEADGIYWHNLPGAKEREQKRDTEIFERYGVTIARLNESNLYADWK